MKDYYQKRVKKRSIILAFFLLLWVMGITFRLIQYQVLEHRELKERMLAQHQNTDSILPRRGTILDRTGVILARSVPHPSIYYTPFDDGMTGAWRDKLRQLDRILDLASFEKNRIAEAVKTEKSFIWIRRKVDPSLGDAIQALSLKGIHIQEESKRLYPQDLRAAHVLGRVDIDEKGQSGVEYFYNSLLQGEAGRRLKFTDAKRREYRFETIQKPVDGRDLSLTIEETIQYIAEKELARGVRESNAEWGAVILSDPRTGEILALANYPSFNPNFRPRNFKSPEPNWAIRRVYDPGSTFKIVTAAAALESGKIGTNKKFDCSEHAISVSNKLFRDHHPFGILSFPEVIIHSSNVGTIQIGQIIGQKALHDTAENFGIGHKTGVDLMGEENGIFHPLDKWTDISVSSVSIGYEMSVTPIQILQVLNVIANEGIYVPPRIVLDNKAYKEILGDKQPLPYRVISAETAGIIGSILEKAVEEGTGKEARIEGYKVVGKTGTSQKYDPRIRQYSSSAHTATFAGYVTTDRPVFSMIVIIDNPKGAYYGGQVSAPIFKNIAEQILRYLQIPPKIKSGENVMAAVNWEGTGT